ncbi:dipeptide epimerase [Streptomyces sp. NPDC047108]|uniref:dipeptide epimerase n=1 Tax=Streptomyces sp. NPDC047108 TaxID=3155025 RepID=UPI0033DBD0C6
MRLTLRTTRLALREPLRISRSVMSARDAVWVRLDHRGHHGYGEVVSSVHLGLSADRAVGCLRELAPVLGRFDEPETALSALAAGELLPPGVPAGVAAAVDSALLDLVGTAAGAPVHALLGDLSPTPSAATARTIGLNSVEDAAAQARALTAQGFTVLKVKAGGPDPEEDLNRVAAVRESAPGARLLLDPNGAWPPALTEHLLPRLAALGVEAVEQPVPPGDPDTLARLARRSPLPLIADEDAIGYEDALRLAGRVQGVNIKLAKCGGVHQALRICEALSGSGTDVMFGCLTASSLGIAPAVHLVGRARWVDLDGHLLLARDPWQGIGGADGTVRAGPAPGLGVTPTAAAAPDTTPDDPRHRPRREGTSA